MIACIHRYRCAWLVSLACVVLGVPPGLGAATYPIESNRVEVIGELGYEHARRSDTLMDIARWLNMGYREIRRANPDVDLWIPGEGTRVLIPSMYVLPDAPREGIVINRAEKRLYYFHENADSGKQQVTTHPIGIGRAGRETPTGSTRVVRKLDDPAWYPTEGVLADYRSRGIELPRMVPPGPDNPLGRHAMVLDLDGYLIHGTNSPDGVGMRVSQGCVRLYPEHIERLIHQVPVDTPVHFIDQPIKIGHRDGHLYLEIHLPPDGSRPERERIETAVRTALERNGNALAGEVEWERVDQALDEANGIPQRITVRPAPGRDDFTQR